MKHRLLIAAAATAIMAAPSLASAQDSGVYIKAQVGYGFVADQVIDGPAGVRPSFEGAVSGEGGFAGALGIGYDYGENWRVELDVSDIYNDLDRIGGAPASAAKLHATSAMFNVLYDFTEFGALEPYVGAGAGVTHSRASLKSVDGGAFETLACVSTPSPGTIRSRTCVGKDKDRTFSWNLIAGVSYNLSDNLSLDTNYRYIDMGSIDVDSTLTETTAGVVTRTTDFVSTLEDTTAHVIMTGFRYRFGSPTPPVVVTPPPPPPTYTCWDGVTEVTSLSLCPVQMFTCWDGVTEVEDLDLCPAQVTYYTCEDGVTSVTDLAACPVINRCEEQFRQELIYYEFDKGQSAETRNTINRILDVGQYCSINSVRVVGHTDTAGPAAYNLGLSERRASDASEELVRQGISSTMISSEGKGETEPFVQTGDGVPEQLNRRTEVLITLSEVGTAMMSN